MKERIEQLTLEHFKYLPERLKFKTEKYQGLELINCGLGSSMFNIAFGGGDIEIQKVIKHFNKQPFAWWIPPSAKSSSFSILLEKAEFVVQASEEIMLCDLKTFDHNYQSKDLRILPALTKEHLQDFISVLLPYDKSTELFYNQFDILDLKGKEKLFIGYEGKVPVVIAILFCDQEMTGIFSLITKEEHRGKGFGGNMMKFLMQFSKQNGAHYCFLSSSSDSGYKIYQSLGFRVIGNFECFEYKGYSS